MSELTIFYNFLSLVPIWFEGDNEQAKGEPDSRIPGSATLKVRSVVLCELSLHFIICLLLIDMICKYIPHDIQPAFLLYLINCSLLSSLKWKLDGNADDNQVHVSQVRTQPFFQRSYSNSQRKVVCFFLSKKKVSTLIFLQNSADSNSPLDCSPDCPQPPPGPGHDCHLLLAILSNNQQ